MAATATDDVHDSRDWALPSYLEQIEGGVRLRLDQVSKAKVLPQAMVWTAAIVVFGVMLKNYGPVVISTAVAMTVLVVAPVAAVWARRAGGVVSAADLRLAGRLGLSVVVALTAVAFVGAAVATVRDIAAGELFAPGSGPYRMVAFLAVVPVLLGASLAGGALRVARRVDPATPPAVLPRDRSLRTSWHTADYGESGARFPKVLPLAFGAPVGAAAWLSVSLGNLGYDFDDTTLIVAMGGGLGLVPLVAGLAWWPWLPLAVGRGLRPGQVRGVGLAYVVGGCVGGLGSVGAVIALVAAEGGGDNVLPGLLGLVMVGALLAVPGGHLVAFGGRLGRAGLRPVAEVPVGQ